MTAEQKISTRLDQQISLWVLRQEQAAADVEPESGEGRPVKMECINT